MVSFAHLYIEDWCKGSTTDFDSVGIGSNPVSSAINRSAQSRDTTNIAENVTLN